MLDNLDYEIWLSACFALFPETLEQLNTSCKKCLLCHSLTQVLRLKVASSLSAADQIAEDTACSKNCPWVSLIVTSEDESQSPEKEKERSQRIAP